MGVAGHCIASISPSRILFMFFGIYKQPRKNNTQQCFLLLLHHRLVIKNNRETTSQFLVKQKYNCVLALSGQTSRSGEKMYIVSTEEKDVWWHITQNKHKDNQACCLSFVHHMQSIMTSKHQSDATVTLYHSMTLCVIVKHTWAVGANVKPIQDSIMATQTISIWHLSSWCMSLLCLSA